MFSFQVPQKCNFRKNDSKVFIKRTNLRIMICQASLNPYKTLGVPSSANDGDVRKAYKKLVLKYHPDVSDEVNAESRFKEIQRAYEIIMGKDSDSWGMEEGGKRGGNSWDFHDWYWSFSMKQRRAKKQGYVQPKVDLQTEEKKTQVRSQISGLKQRAAHRRYKQQYSEAQSPAQSVIHEDRSQKTNNKVQKTQEKQHTFNKNINQQENFEKREKNRNVLRGLGVLGVLITTSFQSFPKIKGRLIDARSTMCAEHKQLANLFLSIYFKPYFDAFTLVFSEYGDMSMEEEFNQVVKERENYQKQPQPVNNSAATNNFCDNSVNNLQHSTKLNNVTQQQHTQYNQAESESQYSYQYQQQNNFGGNHHGFKHDDGKVRSQLAGLKRKAQLKQNGI
eukprot:TRINITY_DN28561_c0_g3_i2.p1 TRINITY_DN28561_c0_g3~~TRINITY_DN28561_c0_g3_i2.p1  ORF type:complete len:391 (+),score=52.90 TRINITY_DN28561_c0_g3_i2:166-1338(+)